MCYHKVERRRELGVTRISPHRFALQIERFARAGWRALTLAELLSCIRGERRLSEREMAITFDDAYRGLRDHAFPVLADHGMPAICFVITDYAGALNRWDVAYGGRRFAHLAWRDIRRWQARGIDFGSHTATHPRLTWLSDAEALRELARSRRVLEGQLDRAAPVVAYPFGAAGARERALAQRAGYAAGFGLAGTWQREIMRIPRLPVYVWAPPVPGLGGGPLRVLERVAAQVTNRCAIGTTVWQRLTSQGAAPTRSNGRPPGSAADDAPERWRRSFPASASPSECR